MFNDLCKVVFSLSVLFLLLSAENVTQYCDGGGKWIQSGATCPPASPQTLKVLKHPHASCRYETVLLNLFPPSLLRPLKDEPGVRAEKSAAVELLLESEERCSEKMERDPPYSRSGRRRGAPTFSLHVAAAAAASVSDTSVP